MHDLAIFGLMETAPLMCSVRTHCLEVHPDEDAKLAIGTKGIPGPAGNVVTDGD